MVVILAAQAYLILWATSTTTQQPVRDVQAAAGQAEVGHH